MHPDDFAREYLAEFGDTRTALFRQADIRAAVQPAVPILGETSNIRPIAMPVLLNDGTSLPNGGFLIAVYLGQSRDHTALAVVEYALVPRHRRDPVYFTWLHDMKLRLRWLDEFPLDASYADLAPILNRLLVHPEVEGALRSCSTLPATGPSTINSARTTASCPSKASRSPAVPRSPTPVTYSTCPSRT